jgi:hypothetical protein
MTTNNDYSEPIGHHKELNPKLWKNDRLKSTVRGALLRIAEDFLDFVDVPVAVQDIVITGGNANVTYSAHSDIDLHIIANLDQLSCDREVEELFDTKRLLYKRDHHIEVFRIPVELYIEDYDSPSASMGVYSIIKDQWIKHPSFDLPEYNESQVEHMVEVWHTIIKHSIMTGDLRSCRKVMELLRTFRKKGLESPESEFSVANLTYKSLRNDHTIEGLTTLINHLHDQQLSL